MTFSLVVLFVAVALIGWLLAYMFAQKPVTGVQQLIHQHRYEEAAAEAERRQDHLHRAEALKLMGRFDDAIASYRRSDDPAAEEGIALSLAHSGGDLDEARRLMEQTIAVHPQIQEFQALALAYILLRRGERDEALRLFDDNRVLLETRFKDDYTDPDPMLAETLWLYAELCEAAGDVERAKALRMQAGAWAPGSVWAEKNEHA
jgi:tetratricopeptide (TPR) repeat protein